MKRLRKRQKLLRRLSKRQGGNSLIDFRNALIQYGEYLERVNLEHDDAKHTILKKYKGDIKRLGRRRPSGDRYAQAKHLMKPTEIRAKAAVEKAVESLERSD